MFITSDAKRASQRLLTNCTCLAVRTFEGNQLQPLCFMTYLKTLNHNLIARLDDYAQKIDPACIMFCHDSEGITDNSYSGSTRDVLNVTGWGHIKSIEGLINSLNCLYWFRKYQKNYKIERLLRSYNLRNFPAVKRYVTQALHTLNGLLIKKFIAFGPEIVGYRDIADQTARLFRDLVSDYLLPAKESGGVFIDQPSVYVQTKELLKLCKMTFHRSSLKERIRWLETKFESRSLGSFFGTEFRRLLNTISGYLAQMLSDYTESPSWVFRCTVFSQTRVLGYLPEHVAEVKRHQYRVTVNRAPKSPGPQRLKTIYLAVHNHLHKSDIPSDVLNTQGQYDDIIFNAINNVAVEIKQNASTDHTVREGGKIEDARKLINRALDSHWKIPVRNFDTHEIVEYLDIMQIDTEHESWSRAIFWISYQLVLNYWIKLGKWPSLDFFMLGDEDYHEDILLAKILHVSEPGKERNLTKSKASFAWFLTPAGKLCQSLLANLPEHKAGLEMAAHDWMHTRRISCESEESGFIYNHETLKLNDDIVHSFKDWTESTDFIGKYIGLIHLKALFTFVGFPRKYGELVLRTISAPQPVEEVCVRRIGTFDSSEITEDYYVEYKGHIREGFMMGNPITKTILHLVHISELEIILCYLKEKGIQIERGYPLPDVLTKVRIPRSETDELKWTPRLPTKTTTYRR
jgi:hypothetical protein